MIWRYGTRAMSTRVLGPLRAHRRMGAVALFHVGRCGSTVLSDLLTQHGRIGWDGESYVRVLARMKSEGLDPSTSGFDPAAYIGDRLDRVGARWFLYNLKFDHIARFGWDMARYLEGIERHGVERMIVLRRRNLLRKLVSGKMAEARAAYHSRAAGSPSRLIVRVDVDRGEMDGRIDSLIGHIEHWERQYDEFDRLVATRPVLRLEYERDILGDPSVAYREVVDFLGLDRSDVDVRLQRLNPFALAEVVENLSDVERALRPTRHAWMLD